MITKKYEVLPLSYLDIQLKRGKIKNKSVYITFDDSYSDNFFNAKPVLEKYNCPATFFVPTYFVGKQELFWWDELESIILHARVLPKKLTLKINEYTHDFNLQLETLNNKIIKKHESWNYKLAPPTNRCKLYIKISALLKPLAHDEIVKSINYLKKWSAFTPMVKLEDLPMSSEQLEVLSKNKLFTLGMHTMTHPALANHAFHLQTNEISGSKKYLSDLKFSKVNAIAYPYGNYNNDTLVIVNQHDISLGFTTEEKIITKASSPLMLGRILASNFEASKLEAKLINFLK